jgi:hypothetical protein
VEARITTAEPGKPLSGTSTASVRVRVPKAQAVDRSTLDLPSYQRGRTPLRLVGGLVVTAAASGEGGERHNTGKRHDQRQPTDERGR